MEEHSDKFHNGIYGDLALSVGKYTNYSEEEDQLYYLAVDGEDDFLIQYDSLSYDHVLSVYMVVRRFTHHKDFMDYFHEYCKNAFLVNRL